MVKTMPDLPYPFPRRAVHEPEDWLRLELVAANVFRIRHAQSGFVAEQAIELPSDGLPIQLVVEAASAGQEWDIERVNATMFRIRSVLTGLVWDLPAGSHMPGTQIHQWHENDGTNQHWFFVPVMASLINSPDAAERPGSTKDEPRTHIVVRWRRFLALSGKSL